MQCAHGDVVVYPVVTVEISGQGKVVSVEAAVSDKLPHSVLLGIDVPEMVSLLKRDDKALMLVTWSQACRLKQNQLEQNRVENVEASSDSEEVVEKAVGAASDGGDVVEESVNTESMAEAEMAIAEAEVENRNLGGADLSAVDDVLSHEFRFDDDVFVSGEKCNVVYYTSTTTQQL